MCTSDGWNLFSYIETQKDFLNGLTISKFNLIWCWVVDQFTSPAWKSPSWSPLSKEGSTLHWNCSDVSMKPSNKQKRLQSPKSLYRESNVIFIFQNWQWQLTWGWNDKSVTNVTILFKVWLRRNLMYFSPPQHLRATSFLIFHTYWPHNIK